MQTSNDEFNVERLAVEEVAETPRRSKPRIVVDPNFMKAHADFPEPVPPVRDERLIEMFKTLGFVLSARALLLLAIVGGFVLAILAALHETRETLYVLVAWCLLTVGPIVALEWRRRDL